MLPPSDPAFSGDSLLLHAPGPRHRRRQASRPKRTPSPDPSSGQRRRAHWRAQWQRQRRGRPLALRQPSPARPKDERTHEGEAEREARTALAIQAWWRRRSMAPLFRRFRAAGASVAHIRALPFAEATRLLQSPALLEPTTRLLARTLLTTAPDDLLRRLRHRSRTFLSAFLLLAHPDDALLDPEREEEMSLIRATKRMLYRLKSLETHVTDGNRGPGARDALDAFTSAWRAYHRAFLRWKQQDVERLLESLRARYAGLASMWEEVQHGEDPEDVHRWHREIRAQQSALEAEALRLGGPSAVASLTARDSSLSPPPLAPSHLSAAEDSLAEPSTEEAPPTEVMQLGWENIHIAHELILNPDFHIEDIHGEGGGEEEEEEDDTPIPLDTEGRPIVASIEEARRLSVRLRAIAQRALFDQMRAEWTDEGKRAAWIPLLVGEAREKLLLLVPETSAFAAHITALFEERRDPDALPSLLTHLLTELLPRMCAPVRDTALRDLSRRADAALSAPGPEVVSVFEDLLRLLRLMARDLSNHRLASLRPLLLQHALPYERAAFSRRLAQEDLSTTKIPHTVAWLSTTVAALKEEHTKRNPEGTVSPPLKYADVYAEAMASLLIPPTPTTASAPSDLPETLYLDIHRIHRWRQEVRTLARTATIALLMRTVAGRPVVAASPDLGHALVRDLHILLRDLPPVASAEDEAHIAAFVAARTPPSPSASPPASDWAALLVHRVLHAKEPLLALLLRRLRATLLAALPDEAPLRPDLLERQGLLGLEDHLEGIILPLRVLVRHNRAVYSPWYDLILKSVV